MNLQAGAYLGDYTFNKATKTVTLTGLSTVRLEAVKGIYNVTRGVTLLQFNNPALVAKSIATNVITLNDSVTTSTMDNADRLAIYLEYDPTASGMATAAKQDALSTKVGEVDPAPTANTILGRLKALYDLIAAGLGRTWALSSGTDSVTVSGTVSVGGTINENLAQVGGTTVLTGTGATGAGSQRVTVAVDGNTVAGSATLPAGTNIVGKVGIDQTTPGTTNRVSIGSDGTVTVGASLPAGTNLLGKVGIDQTTPGTTNRVSIGSDGTVALGAGSATIGKVDQGAAGAAAWAMKSADGDQATIGVTTDAAVVTDANGTVSGKLRGLVKILASVWDSVNGLFHFNLKQVGGTALLTGTGAQAAGSPRVTVAVDSATVAGSASVPAGTNLLGAVTPGASASVGTGVTPFRDPAVTNTAVAIKASAGKLHGYNLYNPNATLAYVHFYDVAAASVVVGTTTPKRSVALPSTATGTVGDETQFVLGIAFGTAISVAASTTATGGSAPATALVVNAEYV